MKDLHHTLKSDKCGYTRFITTGNVDSRHPTAVFAVLIARLLGVLDILMALWLQHDRYPQLRYP